MIKHGMWFENEGHYRYYLQRADFVRKLIDIFHLSFWYVLINRIYPGN